jgi:regulator of cell morphogenesis and NO signaling
MKENLMSAFQLTDTVGSVVRRRPALAQVFERQGIDYCCGGKKTLEEVCAAKGIDPQTILNVLEKGAASSDNTEDVDVMAMSLTELADLIERTHHAYLYSELPRLDKMTEKVASVHGGRDARLSQVRATFLALVREMYGHMMKEEEILFPMIRRLESSQTTPAFHCGSLANPIRQMELEHDEAGWALEKIRTLTDDYAPPEWACNTYRAMLDSLARLESDMHQHVHRENNVLFPRAMEMEEAKSASV